MLSAKSRVRTRSLDCLTQRCTSLVFGYSYGVSVWQLKCLYLRHLGRKGGCSNEVLESLLKYNGRNADQVNKYVSLPRNNNVAGICPVRGTGSNRYGVPAQWR